MEEKTEKVEQTKKTWEFSNIMVLSENEKAKVLPWKFNVQTLTSNILLSCMVSMSDKFLEI